MKKREYQPSLTPLIQHTEKGSLFGWVFSNKYPFTKAFCLLILPLYLFSPVEPWLPKQEELQEITGLPSFGVGKMKRDKTFSVDGKRFHCHFTNRGGYNGCYFLKKLVQTKKPIRITYFPMKTRYGKSASMLNSIEQEGKEIVTPEQFKEKRWVRYFDEKENYKFLFFAFLCLIVLSRKAESEDDDVAEDIAEKRHRSGWTKLKLHFKTYKNMWGQTLFMMGVCYLFSPVEPNLPDESELHHLRGKAEQKFYNHQGGAGYALWVDGVVLNCSFSGMGAQNLCDRYLDRINFEKPVYATYYLKTTRFGSTSRLLNSLEQEGQLLISSEELIRLLRKGSKVGNLKYFLAGLILVAFFAGWAADSPTLKRKFLPKEEGE